MKKPIMTPWEVSGDIDYNKLIKEFGNEFKILFDIDIDAVSKVCGPLIGDGLKRVREGQLHVAPGYDGEFGKVEIFTDEERTNFKFASQTTAQSSLF